MLAFQVSGAVSDNASFSAFIPGPMGVVDTASGMKDFFYMWTFKTRRMTGRWKYTNHGFSIFGEGNIDMKPMGVTNARVDCDVDPKPPLVAIPTKYEIRFTIPSY